VSSRHAWLLTYGESDHEREELHIRKEAFPDHTLIPSRRFFDLVRPRKLPYDKHLVIGDLRAMAHILGAIRAPMPEQQYPEALLPHFGRKIWRESIPRFLARLPFAAEDVKEDSPKYFVKPTQHKKRLPFVARSEADVPLDYLFGEEVTEDEREAGIRLEEVYVQEYTPFLFEFRGFLVNGKFLEFRPYGALYQAMSVDSNRWFGFDEQGNTLPFVPTANAIKAAAALYPEGAHIIDFGYITDEGEPVIVEVNEPYSFGMYGCSPDTLRAVATTHWDSIIPYWKEAVAKKTLPRRWSPYWL
jgi:hypothetical protein